MSVLVSLLLRNFKTYQATHYIALSNGKRSSALVGENGAGKSSVLEALDSYFNNTEWNPHHSLNKGYSEREPFICPIFLLDKSCFENLNDFEWFLNGINKISWEAQPTDFNPSTKTHAELFCAHRDALIEDGYNSEGYYLLPFGLMKKQRAAQPSIYFSIFETLPTYASLIKNYSDSTPAINALHDKLHKFYKYIYLPADINFKEYTKIEGRTIQALLGQKLDTIVRTFIKRENVTEINSKLNAFIGSLSDRLGDYVYKKPAQKQNLVTQSHLTAKIIEAYFESKVLNKRIGKETTQVSDLSSGEKRQALIDVAKAFLTASELPPDQQVILAIDEPELSLHISVCFEQFEKLSEISASGVQTLVTTHWYGFMPILTEGVAVYCPKTEDPPLLIDLRCFREDIKKVKIASQGKLPIELELKGINDLVQSIIASITSSNYSWIICEGSSDKIYLEHYLSAKRLFIVPVGGSPTVKKIFSYLYLALEDTRADVQGKVFCLLDTDKKFESFDAKESISNIQIKRIKNNENSCITELLKTSDNDASPATVIEDTLHATPFSNALMSFKDDLKYGPMIKKISSNLEITDPLWPSAFALNLNFTDRKTLEEIFQTEGFKVKFALRYVELDDDKNMPSWIKEIHEFLTPTRPRGETTKRRSRGTTKKKATL